VSRTTVAMCRPRDQDQDVSVRCLVWFVKKKKKRYFYEMQPYSYFLSNIPAGIAIFSTMDELAVASFD